MHGATAIILVWRNACASSRTFVLRRRAQVAGFRNCQGAQSGIRDPQLGDYRRPGAITPDHASPEQLRGEEATPASDIFALGLVLYRLLTGVSPYAAARDLPQIVRMICYEDPVKPSSIRGDRELPGELDDIVLKALHKQPEQRYGSVTALSAEIERCLERPVEAPRRYTHRRSVWRNRTALAVTAAVVFAAVVLVLIFERSRTSGTGGARAVAPSSKRSSAAWEHVRFEKIATLGEKATDGISFSKYFVPWGLNNQGDIVFATEALERNGGEVIFLSKNAGQRVLSPLARDGDAAPGGGTFEGADAGIAINDSREVFFAFGLAPWDTPALMGLGKAGLYRYSPIDGRVSAVVIPGRTPAPGYGVFEGALESGNVTAAGDNVFVGVVRTTVGLPAFRGLGVAIFSATRGAEIRKLLGPSDRAPGSGSFDWFRNPSMNERGEIAFGAHIAGEECINISIGCGESIYFRNSSGTSIQSIAHQKEMGPAYPYAWAWGAVINSRGEIAFMGEVAKPGLRQARGLFLYSRGTTIPIAEPGDYMPDGRKILTVNPAFFTANYSINSLGEVCFSASLENGESAFYVYSAGSLYLIAGTNSVIPGAGTLKTVMGFHSMGGILNDRGQVLFWGTLMDGNGVLLLGSHV